MNTTPFGERYHVQLNNGHVYVSSRLAPPTSHASASESNAAATDAAAPATGDSDAQIQTVDRPRPAADQPEPGPHPPAPRPVRSTFEGPPPAPPGPVPTEPSVKQGPPPKTPPPRIPRSDPHAQVQRPIQKGIGRQKAPATKPPPARRMTLHYILVRPGSAWPYRETNSGRSLAASGRPL